VTGVDAFAAPRTVFGGAGLAVARPTWSPDSALISFQHSEHSRIREDPAAAFPRFRAPASCASRRAMARPAGSSSRSTAPRATATIRRSRRSTRAATSGSPSSRRATTATRRRHAGTGRRQLWVAAVRNAPASGVDPSFAPYWLPQQDVLHENMAAFWAEEACRADGRTCATSGECCSGFCRDTGSGPMCVPPDIVECSMTGEACRTSADCCAGQATAPRIYARRSAERAPQAGCNTQPPVTSPSTSRASPRGTPRVETRARRAAQLAGLRPREDLREPRRARARVVRRGDRRRAAEHVEALHHDEVRRSTFASARRAGPCRARRRGRRPADDEKARPKRTARRLSSEMSPPTPS